MKKPPQDEHWVLFLDDAGWRHSEFTRRTDQMPPVRVWQAHHAAGAIEHLKNNRFDQVFLDHDLSEEDQMKAPGDPTRVPTGMTVVDFIVGMKDPPEHVIVHTCNGPAGDEMVRRLRDYPTQRLRVDRLPFPALLAMMDANLGNQSR